MVTGKENTNHAYDMGLYTYQIHLTIRDLTNNSFKSFRSIRALSRYLKVSMNYIRPRIVISNIYPLKGRYIITMNFKQYIEHISKLPSGKPVYCYSYITKLHYRLSSISQISILFGISYINIGKKLFTNSKSIVYTGGYLFSGCIITKKDIKNISSEEALTERNKIWEKLSIDNKVVPSGTLKMGLKRNGIPHITMGEDIVSSIDKIAL